MAREFICSFSFLLRAQFDQLQIKFRSQGKHLPSVKKDSSIISGPFEIMPLHKPAQWLTNCRTHWFFCLGVILLYCHLVVWFFCDPMDCSPPGSSFHGFSQARILEWVAISFSRGFSQPRDWTQVSWIDSRILYRWGTREAPEVLQGLLNIHAVLPGWLWLGD